MLKTISPDGFAAPTNRDAHARAERAAELVGLTASEVEQLPFDLSVLEDEGLFVNVDAGGFGMLDRSLDWQALGITLPRGTDVSFRPPHCGLLPDRYRLPLLRPAARAHNALHRYSYRFRLAETLFETPAYRWIPWRAFSAFEQEFQATQAALDAAKSEVLGQYEAVREEVVETFLQLAADSARRLEATGHGIPEGYQEAVVCSVMAGMPGAEDLREKLVLRYRVGVILLGSEMVAEQRKTREERRRLEEADAELRVTRQRQDARLRLVQEEFWAEEERIRRRLQAEEDDRQREAQVKDRMRQLKLEATKERLKETLSPLEEGAKQLHTAVYEAAAAMRAALEKHHYLPGASAKRARDLARWFKLMDWQSDSQLQALVSELETLASRSTNKKQRDPAAVNQVLGDIIELCYADARALNEPNRMGALEL